MARLAWAHLCESAFLDSCGRLCLIGVTARLPVPALPIAVHQLMIAARVIDVAPNSEFDVAVGIHTPGGAIPAPEDPESLAIEMALDYVLITFRNLPLVEEGMYRFNVSVGADGPLTLEIPVFLISSLSPAHVH